MSEARLQRTREAYRDNTAPTALHEPYRDVAPIVLRLRPALQRMAECEILRRMSREEGYRAR